MAAGNATQIMMGGVDMYIKTFVAGQGDSGNNPITGNTVSWSGWTQLGFPIEDGLTGEYTPTFVDVRSATVQGILRQLPQDEAYQVTFGLNEPTLEYMQYAIAGSTYTAAAVPGTNPNSLKVGGLLTFPEYSFGFEGISPSGTARVLFVPRTNSMGPSGITHNKQGPTTIPVVLTGLFDHSRTAGQQLYIMTDLTSPTQASTTLTTPGVDESDATIPVVSTTGFSASGNILIDEETMAYASVDATNFLTVTRSVESSPNEARAHTAEAIVLEVP